MTVSTNHTTKSPFYSLQEEKETGFVKVYREYWPKLFAIAYNRLQSKQAAEDVVQEVMIGLWQSRENGQIKNLDAWLATAVKYAVFRQLAKFGSHRIESIAVQPEKSYDQPFDFHFLEKILKEQIQQLPERCKLVFEYSRHHGLSNKEISNQLEISEKTVEKHITKAIHTLRRTVTKAFFL